MCFSATASFTAAAIIGIIGVATLKDVKSKSLWLLALIPLFFAFQQASEGMVWLSLERHSHIPISFAKYFFLFIALVLWPFWVPLALHTAEPDQQRKSWIFWPLAIGVVVSLINVSMMIRHGAVVDTLGHRINYDAQLPFSEYLLIGYSIAVLLPWFLSSLKYTKLFGWLCLGSLIVSIFFFVDTLTSVWCFFAALLSSIIYQIIRHAGRKSI